MGKKAFFIAIVSIIVLSPVSAQQDFGPETSFSGTVSGMGDAIGGLFSAIVSNIGKFASPDYLATTLLIAMITYISIAVFVNVANNRLPVGSGSYSNPINKMFLADDSSVTRGKFSKGNLVIWLSLLTVLTMHGSQLDFLVNNTMRAILYFLGALVISLLIGALTLGPSAILAAFYGGAGMGSKTVEAAYSKAYNGSKAQSILNSIGASGGAALGGILSSAYITCPSCNTDNLFVRDKCKNCGTAL